MKDSEPSGNICPPQVELSAWTDGYAEADLEPHLEVCVECRRVVTDYRRIDDATRGVIQPDAQLAGRIQSACRGLSRDPMPLGRQRWLWPYAAAAAAAAAIFIVGLIQWYGPLPDSAEPSVKVAAHVPELPPAAPVVIPAPPHNGIITASVPIVADKVFINNDDLAMTAAGPRRSNAVGLSYSSAAGRQSTVLISARVRHVWVVDDLEQSRKLLLDALPDKTSVLSSTRRAGTLSFQVLIPDQRLQKLVDQLAGSGRSLLSSSAPQPGCSRKLIVTGRMVRYDVEFVAGH